MGQQQTQCQGGFPPRARVFGDEGTRCYLHIKDEEVKAGGEGWPEQGDSKGRARTGVNAGPPALTRLC